MWVAATAVSAIMVAGSGLINTAFFKILIVIAAVWLVFVFSGLLKNSKMRFNPFYYFMRINYFVLVMIFCMSIDPLL